jgi:hypothetical protein
VPLALTRLNEVGEPLEHGSSLPDRRPLGLRELLTERGKAGSGDGHTFADLA